MFLIYLTFILKNFERYYKDFTNGSFQKLLSVFSKIHVGQNLILVGSVIGIFVFIVLFGRRLFLPEHTDAHHFCAKIVIGTFCT